MPERPIFHLSLPVHDLAAAERFYRDVLDARIGRRAADWFDALLWGHQLTLHLDPESVLPPARQGRRHFGVILPWPEWEALAARLAARGTSFLAPPEVLRRGTLQEQAKLYLADPSHNVLEIKAYRDVSQALEIATSG